MRQVSLFWFLLACLVFLSLIIGTTLNFFCWKNSQELKELIEYMEVKERLCLQG